MTEQRAPASIDDAPTVVDAHGRRWRVVDFRVVRGERRRVPLGSKTANGRAFVPDGWLGPVQLRAFRVSDYRGTDLRTLQAQLHFAKRAGQTVAAFDVPSTITEG